MKTNLKSGKKFISCIIIACMLTSVLPCIIANANEKNQNQTIAIGWDHYAMIKEDGSLWTWGSNAQGGLGNGTTEYSDIPVNIMNDVISVSLGDDYSAAIKADGSLWMWGDNGAGQLGDKTSEDRYTPVKIMDDVKSVSTGRDVVAAIKTDGSLWTWGAKGGFYSEQLGNESERYSAEDYCTPMKIMDDVLSIFIGDEHCAAIKTDGSLWMWGDNLHGELGNGSTEDSYVPIKIMEDVLSASLGNYNSAVIKTDGSLWIWGSNLYKLVENTRTDIITTPTKITEDVKSVSVGDEVCVVIKNNGTLWGWGNDTYEALGNGEGNDSAYGYENAIKILDDIDSVVARRRAVAALSKDGFLWIWGDSDMTEPLQIATNVMIPKAINNINSAPKEPTKNNPVLSVNSPITITLGKQEWVTGWIDGIYNKIPEAEFIVTSSNEDILPVISQDSMCMSPITDGDECFSSISAFVKGAAPGTSTLTFYCQGEKLGTIDVTVEAVIAETISDETILKAEILNRNSQFDSHRNTIQSPAVVLNNALMNNSSQSWATAYMFTYELSKILSLSIPDLEKFDMKSYYEAVLMDILENDNESVWSDFYSTWGNIYGGYNEDIVQKIIDEIPEFEKYKDTKLSKETDIEIVLDTIKDTKGEFKDIKIDFSLFDTFGFCYDTLTDNLAVIDEIYAYSAITQEKIDVLKAIQEKTSNAELAKACESMIKRYQEVHSEVVAEVATSAARESLIATGKNILELSQSVTVDLFLQVAQTTSAAELVKSYSTGKMIMTGSRLATDLVINSTDISKNIFVIAAYSDIENEIKKVISSSETAFEGNKTYDNAVKYIASADVFKAALLNSCDLYIKFVKDVESGTKGLEIAKGLILGEPKDILKNLWQVNAEYNEKIKQAEHIKSMIQTTDFYDTYGTDIVEYISHIVSTTPSAWAQEYVDWAIANNLLPYDYLRGNYQNNITRAEFCTLLTFMIQEFTGKNIEELQGNLPYDPKLFSDSYYDYVYYMASLGIVNGVSETEFNPLGEITREEAAVMLYRAAKVAGCDVSAPATNLNGVSNWATDGVNFVVDRGIMNGTDVGFEPQGKYTKEQAITTFVRFIENLK